MRVFVVIGQLNHRCGPSVNGVRLARHLIASGWDVRLVHCTPPVDADSDLEQEFGDRLLGLPYVHPLDPRWALAFSSHTCRLKPEVVHLNTPTQALVLAPPARLAGTLVIYTMGNLLEYNAKWLQRGLRFIAPRCIRQIVGVSHAVTEDATRHRLSRVRPITIYNGVEAPDADERARERIATRTALGVSDDEIVVGTCGRLSPDKEQIHLLKATALLRDHDFRLLIVGDGQMREPMEAFCTSEELTNVHFAGWQTDVTRFLAAMDVFAFHSMPFAEGLPTVVTEAAMMGLPLVLADLPCLREVYADEEQALFAAPGEPAEFAAQIERMLTSPALRARLGAAAREVAHEQFSIPAMAEHYARLYRSLCEDGDNDHD